MIRLLSYDALGNLIFTEFHNPNQIPAYAILSHTWDVDNKKEVTFEDVETGNAKNKPAYHKIEFCAEKAAAQGLQYFWIDTCCINKKDLTELSEAIISMFKWYQRARCCYVYLADVPARFDISGDASSDEGIHAFRNSRWFTRGWTLQELIAPRNVDFYARNGEFLGNRQSLRQLLCMATNIEPKVLSGHPVSAFDFAERQSWAMGRETTREEDIVYSLMGICEVSMPVLYGEGRERALRRLENEIDQLKRKLVIEDDESSSSSSKRRKVDAHAAEANDCNPQAIEHDLVKLLRFTQMDDRRSNIKRNYKTTCKWLLHDPVYTDWLDAEKYYEHHGFFWIKGKPGSGKSTLTKFVFEQVQQSSRNVTILSFFFHGRGTDLERSTTGLYRSLLVQVLDSFPDIQDQLRSSYLRGEPWDPNLQTDPNALSQLLAQAISLIRKQNFILIIDALDECADDEVRHMISFFEDLGNDAVSYSYEFRVLFSSRHYPRVTVERSVELVLDNQVGHAEDIQLYVSGKLKAGTGKHIESIKHEICEKSSGIFMWVFLVVEILNEAFDKGDVQALREKLRDIPDNLKKLFHKILAQDRQKVPEMLLCLQWILYARRPLRPKELYFAILTGLRPDQDPTPWDREHPSRDDMARFILSSSKGLAEIAKPEYSHKYDTVQFIHESVRDYLLDDHGLGEIWSELSPSAAGLSHDRLKDRCHKFATFDFACHLQGTKRVVGKLSSEEDDVHRDLISKFPHLEYREVGYKHGSLILKFPFLEYAVENMFHHAELAQRRGINQKTFLEGVDLDQLRRNQQKVNPYISFYPRTLLSILADENCLYLAELLLSCGVDINAQSVNYGTALMAARSQEMVELLLNRGADINAQGHYGQTALRGAASCGDQEIVEVLLNRGADINAQGGMYGTALQTARHYRHYGVAAFLLSKGAREYIS